MENNERKDDYIKSLIKDITDLSVDSADRQDKTQEILEIFNPLIKSLVKKFASRGADFDDISQQIALIVIEAIHDYDSEKDNSPIRHIYYRAKNRSWNFFKKEMSYFDSNKVPISLDNMCAEINKNGYKYKISQQESVPEELHTYIFEDDVVARIMIEDQMDNHLTPQQKDVITMYYLDDMTQTEVASSLNIDQSNVSRAKNRGIKKMIDNFQTTDEDDKHDKN